MTKNKFKFLFLVTQFLFLTSIVSAQLLHPTGNLQGSSTGACPQSACSGTYTDNGGTTANYSNDINNFWTVCSSTPGQCVRFTFTSFDMNDYAFFACGGYCDGMIIYDGPVIGGTVLYSGSVTNPGTITSTTGCLSVRVISDETVTRPGWLADISCVPCTGGQQSNTNSDCSNATVLCSSNTLTDVSAGPGAVLEGCDGTVGCLLGEVYSNWYSVTIGSTGTIAFTINPEGGGSDFDFQVFGPFTGNSNCSNLGFPIRCSFAEQTGNTGLKTGNSDNSEDWSGNGWVAPINAVAGQTYLIMINKWGQVSNGNNSG
jgi:hypothetical protein